MDHEKPAPENKGRADLGINARTPDAHDRELGTPLGTTSETGGAPPGPESALWSGRTSWKHFGGRLGLWLLGNILAAVFVAWLSGGGSTLTGNQAFWIVVSLLIVSGLVVGVPVLLTIWGHRYRLTTERLIIERGILSQTIDQTELIRVDDVRMHKSVVDRLFGLGSVEVVSTDVTDKQILIPGVAAPEQLAEAVRSRMRAMRKKSLYVENL